MNEQEKILQELREIKEGISIIRHILRGIGITFLAVLIGAFLGEIGTAIQFIGGALGVIYTLVYMFSDPKKQLEILTRAEKEKQRHKEAKKEKQ